MTRDDLIRLANVAGITGPGSPKQGYRMFASPEKLEKFAWLITTHEREACIWLCEMIAAEKGNKGAEKCVEALHRRGEK